MNETKGNLLSHWGINVPQRIEGNENSVFYNYVYEHIQPKPTEVTLTKKICQCLVWNETPILAILCPEVEKSDFSCSWKPPETWISGNYIDLLVL